MPTRRQPKPPTRKRNPAVPAEGDHPQGGQSQDVLLNIPVGGVVQQQQQTKIFQGPTPPPEVLERYDALVPGTAQRLFNLAVEESQHRRKLEDEANQANINAQQKQLEIADYQTRSVFRSDVIGQVAGGLVSLSCVAGSVFLASTGHDWAAGALAAIPTAAVIRAFFVNRHPST